MKYYTLFDTKSEYTTYIGNNNIQNITYVVEEDKIYYHDEELFNYEQEYFTIEPLTNGTISFSKEGLLYSTDKVTWASLGTTSLSISQDQKVYLKGTISPNSSDGIGTLSVTSNINVSGNVMSLLFGDNYIDQISLSGKDYAFKYLFYNNTYLINAQNLILPATTLASSCYGGMFCGCEKLITCPSILPAIQSRKGCYASMFNGCTSLTTTPILSAIELQYGSYCYQAMFENCTSLITAPELPATRLSSYCYQQMFNGCTSLTTAPELPTISGLTVGCYSWMFANCTSLTTAPELPATLLSQESYDSMFYRCTSLNYIKCLATNISATFSTRAWVNGVAATGTFVKDSSMSSWKTGTSGIPTNWTVEDASN